MGCKKIIEKIASSENEIQQELKYNLAEDLKHEDNTFISRFKSVYLVTSDLDGDGIRENINLRVDPKYFKPINIDDNSGSELDSVPAILLINDQFLRLVLNFNCLTQLKYACEIKIIDINPSDNLKEVVLSIRAGDLIDPPIVNHILRFVENKISNTIIDKDNLNGNLNVNGDNYLMNEYKVDKTYDSAYVVKQKLCIYKLGLGIVSQDTGSIYWHEYAD